MDIKFWSYMKVFDPVTWTVIIGFIILLTFGLMIIQISGIEQFHIAGDPEYFGFFNALSLNLLLLGQKDYTNIRPNVCLLLCLVSIHTL